MLISDQTAFLSNNVGGSLVFSIPDDALFLNADCNLTEATTSNVWLVEGESVVTPPLGEGLLAGISWRLGERLVLGPGFGWFTEPGDSINAFPVVIIDWAITPRLTLGTGRGLAASQGPGLTLSYRFGQNWTLGLTGRYEKVRFAVQRDDAPEVGIGQDKSFPLLLTLDYSPWPMTHINLLLGAELNGELRLEDEQGSVLGDVNYEPAPLLGFSFRSLF